MKPDKLVLPPIKATQREQRPHFYQHYLFYPSWDSTLTLFSLGDLDYCFTENWT